MCLAIETETHLLAVSIFEALTAPSAISFSGLSGVMVIITKPLLWSFGAAGLVSGLCRTRRGIGLNRPNLSGARTTNTHAPGKRDGQERNQCRPTNQSEKWDPASKSDQKGKVCNGTIGAPGIKNALLHIGGGSERFSLDWTHR